MLYISDLTISIQQWSSKTNTYNHSLFEMMPTGHFNTEQESRLGALGDKSVPRL